MNRARIIFQHLTYSLNDNGQTKPILNRVSGIWEQGCSIALRGVSGSGKTTLLSTIAGLRHPTGGTVTYEHMEQRAIGYLFQESLLIPFCTVIENVILKDLIAGRCPRTARDMGMQLLTQAGVAEKADAYPQMVSGGQQQRIAVARALYGNPPFLMLDEPTAHLDHAAKHGLMDLLTALQQEYGFGMIIATHDDAVAAYMGATITVIDGSIYTYTRTENESPQIA